MNATDRMQAAVFLDSVNSAMKNVSNAYRNLKSKMRALNNHHDNDSDCSSSSSWVTEDVMRCAVITNFSMQHIEMMEKELEFDHPHLTTFYRIIVCVFMVAYIDELSQILCENKKNVPTTELTAFLGDVVENLFRSCSNREKNNNIEQLVANFCRKWSIPRGGDVDHIVWDVLCATNPDNKESELQTIMRRRYKFIGGKRCIFRTQANIQFLSSQEEATDRRQRRKFTVLPGALGTLWNEDEKQECLARKFDDFNQLLMQDILPEWVGNCLFGKLLTRTIFQKVDVAIPLFKSLYRFLENYSQAVPLSLTFGMHAMLTSIYELQGNNDVGTVANVSKSAYNLFFEQVQEQIDSKLPHSNGWRRNLDFLMERKDLPVVACNYPVNERSEEHAFWNPYSAGMFLTHLSFQTNLVAGAEMIDSFAELHIVLHLYNGLQQRNLITGNNNIPLLTSLDHFFDGVKFVWGGDRKPKRDNLVKRFWLVYGARPEHISQRHEACRLHVLTPPEEYNPLYNKNFRRRDGSMWRERTPHNAADFSESYKRICFGDFSGVDDGKDESLYYTDGEKSTAEPWDPLFVSRTNHTLDSMKKERELLSWNLAAVGGCLNAFIYHLIEGLGWRDRLDDAVASMPDYNRKRPRIELNAYKERFAIIREISYELLGPLEFLDSVEHHPVVLKARDCLIEYFTTMLDESKYKYLNILEKDEAEEAVLAAKRTLSG